MKKLPRKWKFFLVLSYVQLFLFGVILIALIISFFSYRHFNSPDLLTLSLVALGLLLLCLNMFLCVYAVHRYFPDTLIPRGVRVVMKANGIISILLFAGLLCLFVFGLTEELAAKGGPDRDKSGIYILILLFFLLTTGVFILILQFGMFRFLKRNHEAKLDSLINSIGTH